jgi:hypothetical protein
MAPPEEATYDSVGENSGGGEAGQSNVVKETETTTPDEDDDERTPEYSTKVLEYLREARDDTEATTHTTARGFSHYRNIAHAAADEDGDADQISTPARPLSPGNSSSIQDETLSVQVSYPACGSRGCVLTELGFIDLLNNKCSAQTSFRVLPISRSQAIRSPVLRILIVANFKSNLASSLTSLPRYLFPRPFGAVIRSW